MWGIFLQELERKAGHPILEALSNQEAAALCQTLREELIQDVSQTGGHLASNLGAVELTVAIHRVLDTSRDRLVFDVGHQCYLHKMLTGRREQMATLRQFGGIAGYPKPSESGDDAFIAGHASNSVAVALGMAQARDILGENYTVAALIGDGALTGGLAYEGLSNAGQYRGQLLVILNDNGMSIAENVGAVAQHLASQRLKPQYLSFKQGYRKVMGSFWLGRKIYRVTHSLKKALKQSILPCSMFENMGFTYLGPVDGHDLTQLTKILRYAVSLKEPVLLHVRTVKGKGFLPAERNPDAFHGVSPFDPATGDPKKASGENFSSVFGRTMVRLARTNSRLCALTAAMVGGTGLEGFAQAYPGRFFDVGIAEGCAVSMAAGMAKQGAVPVFAVYSTFLQRSYDMLLHDVAIDRLHVVLAVDRAGLVGEDGETHHGVFDVAYLDSVPGITVYAPSNFAELDRMLEEAIEQVSGPVAVRYPRGGQGAFRTDSGAEPWVVLRRGTDITLAGYGVEINELLGAAEQLSARGIEAEVVKWNIITPLDTQGVITSVTKTGHLLVAEECVEPGCVGERVLAALEMSGTAVKAALVNCGREYVTHGSTDVLKKSLGLDQNSLFCRAMEVLDRGQ